MNEVTRHKALQFSLVAIGAIFIVGVWPLMQVWPSGWAWHTDGRSEYAEMIVIIYVTLGVFLIRAARNPLAHASLIWFTVWSSLAHGALMAVQALGNAHHRGHLLGDVPALFVVAGVLAALMPRQAPARETP